ncbi:MAG TPA: methylmalonyl-CoA mutase family protein [Saprospiraceae bacterium]|nr:methylmalonyl-CoA mutase family protein [Saprospiraceae bacterium]
MFDQFKKISTGEWLAQIEKELGSQRKLEDTRIKIGEHITLFPFLDESSRKSHSSVHSWPSEVRSAIPVKRYTTNEQILKLLSLGAGAIYFQEDVKIIKEQLLKGIEPGFISWIGYKGHALPELLNEKIKGKDRINKIEIYEYPNEKHIIQTGKFYEIDDYSKNVLSILNNVIPCGMIIIELSNHILFQIALLRAIRLYTQKKNMINDVKILAICRHTAQYAEERLISETLQSISARLGGAHYISFEPVMDEEKDFSREKIHIQNILDFETQLNRISDPVAGSYVLENLTEQILDLWL